MKLYSAELAPSPRRVRMFIAEKNIEGIDMVTLNLPKGENRSDDFAEKNPMKLVPVLELEDGTCISESNAIFRYLEEIYPQPALMGSTAVEKAIIEMWYNRVDHGFFYQAIFGFQHSSGFFKDRMTPVPEWGAVACQNVKNFLPVLEQQLGQNEYVAGSGFSVADINAICALDFAKAVNVRVEESELPAIYAWRQKIKERKSYTA